MSVVPGALLGTEEEFIPGANTALDGSAIYASAVGESEVREKVVQVRARANVPVQLRPGDVVVGRVERIYEPIALIDLAWRKEGGTRQVGPAGYAVLHASHVRDGYVKNVHDEVKIGDIVRARIEKIERGEVELTVKEPGLGVVVAFCTGCRARMTRKGEGFYCSGCDSSEGRKAAEAGKEG